MYWRLLLQAPVYADTVQLMKKRLETIKNCAATAPEGDVWQSTRRAVQCRRFHQKEGIRERQLRNKVCKIVSRESPNREVDLHEQV